MKVLLVRGNPRKSGFTQYLVDLFAGGLRDAGAQITDVDLASEPHALKPCLGCYHCWVTKPGECIHHDAMDELVPTLLEADVLVCATPVYYFAMSSQLKIFFERLFPLSAGGMEWSRMGLLRNRMRVPARNTWPRSRGAGI